MNKVKVILDIIMVAAVVIQRLATVYTLEMYNGHCCVAYVIENVLTVMTTFYACIPLTRDGS